MKAITIRFSAFFLATLLAACASPPIIDPQGVDMQVYQNDLAQCEQLADQINTGGKVAEGAVIGGAMGGATGAIWHEAGEGAAAGAIAGAAQGGFGADHEKAHVVRNCLRHRGYVVLN